MRTPDVSKASTYHLSINLRIITAHADTMTAAWRADVVTVERVSARYRAFAEGIGPPTMDLMQDAEYGWPCLLL
jgi:hypothetical protein